MTGWRITRFIAMAVVTASFARCALYSDVVVRPMSIDAGQISRGTDIEQSMRRNDILGAVAHGAAAATRQRSAEDVAAYGAALLAAGRYDEARRQLTTSLELKPSRATHAQAAWSLSQVEYMQNNYGRSLEWAKAAHERDLRIRQWHLDYLEALSTIEPYRFSGTSSVTMPMRIGKPDVPRVETKVNDQVVTAIIDSGAVLSIISREVAERIQVRSLGRFRGEFFGLLGEPITVEFGLIETLTLGTMIVQNVPVAIMPGEKMRFAASGTKRFEMEMLLGANFLKEFRTELDFARDAVTFARLTADDRVPDPRQNLFIDGFRPHVRTVIQRKGWFLLLLDTGSEITFLNGEQAPVSTLASGMHSATMQGLGGATKSGQKVKNIEVAVDDWAGVFTTLPMYGANEHDRASGILGENFLRNFKVTIDFGRMRLDLQRR